MLLHCSYFGTSFGESIWRLNTYISSLLTHCVQNSAWKSHCSAPPKCWPSLLCCHCSATTLWHNTLLLQLWGKNSSQGVPFHWREHLWHREGPWLYHIQGATKPCSRNHYNDFTANGLKCWIFKQKQLTSTPRALVSHTFSSLPNQQKVNEY